MADAQFEKIRNPVERMQKKALAKAGTYDIKVILYICLFYVDVIGSQMNVYGLTRKYHKKIQRIMGLGIASQNKSH